MAKGLVNGKCILIWKLKASRRSTDKTFFKLIRNFRDCELKRANVKVVGDVGCERIHKEKKV